MLVQGRLVISPPLLVLVRPRSRARKGRQASRNSIWPSSSCNPRLPTSHSYPSPALLAYPVGQRSLSRCMFACPSSCPVKPPRLLQRRAASTGRQGPSALARPRPWRHAADAVLLWLLCSNTGSCGQRLASRFVRPGLGVGWRRQSICDGVDVSLEPPALDLENALGVVTGSTSKQLTASLVHATDRTAKSAGLTFSSERPPSQRFSAVLLCVDLRKALGSSSCALGCVWLTKLL